MSTWLIINVIIGIIAAAFLQYVYVNDRSENYNIILPLIAGVLLFIGTAFSEVIRWVIG